MRDIFARIAFFCAILFCWTPAVSAQGIDSEIEQMVFSGATQSQIEDYLLLAEDRERNRLDLNAASGLELEQSGLFTPFQRASLLEYRKEYGRILSFEELALVDGFSAGFVGQIAPFVTLEGPRRQSGKSLKIRSRYKYKSGEKGLHCYNRVRLEAGPLRAGLLAESDAGEKLPADYLGWYLTFKTGGFDILLGDYTACFGQGLAMWNAFSMASASSPSSLLRRPAGLAPYASADENRALRGLAVRYAGRGGVQASVFTSVAGVDARLGDGGYTSIMTTGYHRTIAEKESKNAMREYLAGGNISFGGDCFRISLTALAYSYSKHNARRQAPYNQFQMYDGWMGNASLEAVYSSGHWRFFAEAASDARFHAAALAGVSLTASYDFEACLMARYYDKSYIATHAGAYSTISSISNQAGGTLAVLVRPLRSLLITSMTEAVYYPWLRYRVDGPSFAVYEKLRAEYKLGRFTAQLQDNYMFQSSDGSHKHSFKASFQLGNGPWKGSICAGWVLLARRDGPSSGLAVAAAASKSFLNDRINLTASVAYYDAARYDARVYIYEGDLPGSFSLQYYYGKGIAARCMVKAKAGRRLTLSAVAVGSSQPQVRVQADISF